MSSESNWVAFKGEIYLALTLIIISSNNSVFALLNSWDEEIFTPCTVLCVSNTIGVVFVLAYYKFVDCTLTMSEVEKVPASAWAWLTVGTLLYSVIGPLLLFLGVAKLGVPIVTIVQRLESVNVLINSYMFLGMTVTWWTICNAALCLFGVTVALLSSRWLPGNHDNTVEVDNIGWVYVVIAGWCTTFSLTITMKYVRALPVSIVTCFRVVFGVVAYQLLMVIFGEKQDKWDSLKVWRVIVPYAFIYVFLAQVLLLTALKRARPLSVSVGTNCTFFLSLAFAAAIVQEYPSTPEIIGAAFIGVSIMSAMYEIVCRHRVDQEEEDMRITMGLGASFGDRSLLGDNRSKKEGSDGQGGGARWRSSRTSRTTVTLADRLISLEGGSSVYSFYEDRISSWAVEE